MLLASTEADVQEVEQAVEQGLLRETRRHKALNGHRHLTLSVVELGKA